MSNARSEPDHPGEPERWALTREDIASGKIRAMIKDSGYPYAMLSDDELDASIAAIRAERPGREVWLFGYGSLIWNPAFYFAERRIGLVHGYHRRFCLWTHAGRGSVENPGLTLGLDRGGSVRGCAFRLSAAQASTELDIVWRREMVSGAYAPRWVTVRTSAGAIEAITFVINHTHERYAGLLPERRVAEVIATAAGGLGHCADYLFTTVEHLHELDIADHALERLSKQVAALQAAAG